MQLRDFCDKVRRARTPDAVLDLLNTFARPLGLTSMCAWQLPFDLSAQTEYTIGKNVFIYSGSPVPLSYWIDVVFPRVKREGPSVLVQYARRQDGCFTLTQAMKDCKPTPRQRAIFDELRDVGCRDGVGYAGKSGLITLLSSPTVLDLRPRDLDDLLSPMILAKVQLQKVVGRTMWRRTPLNILTARQRDVMYWRSCGLSIKETAERMGVKQNTVKGHYQAAIKNLKAKDHLHALRIALRNDLIP